MKKIIFYLILAFFVSENTFSQSSKLKYNNVSKIVSELKKDKDMRNASVSFYAIDVNSNEIVAQLNKNLSMKPASTMKLFSSAAALETLGKNYRFKTEIVYTGKIDTATKTLHGNIIIIGGGDPTLGSKYFYSTKNKQFLVKWVKAIKDLGIEHIDGSIIADARKYSRDMIPPTWSWEDFG
ncbi:MAG: D-alanyl-D-alanine carboxypeptidase, partial [Bacteroidota bacterium]|nr:D-alanyl-D-alanine carboxypeptidase [Bacteroidota bacterium]